MAIASWPIVLLAGALAKLRLAFLPSALLVRPVFGRGTKAISGNGDVELVHLDPVLQRFRLLLPGSLHLLDLPPDGILKRAKLAGFQPPERLVPAIQSKALPLVAALYGLTLDAMAFRRVELGIAPQGRND